MTQESTEPTTDELTDARVGQLAREAQLEDLLGLGGELLEAVGQAREQEPRVGGEIRAGDALVGDGLGDELAVAVYPALVRAEHPLAGLTGTSSGVIVDGDVVGRTLYAGAGAGSLPTASAVVADMIDVAGGTAQATFDTVRMFNDQTAQPRYRPPDQVESGFYVRCRTDRMAVDALGAALRDSGVNVDRVEPVPAHDSVVAITASALRADVDRAVGCSAGGQAAAADQPVILRVHSDESC